MKPSTQAIHISEGISRDAAPLTTPIYETTTFLFESAQEVLDYNEGRSQKFLYSRYANPTVVAVEQKIAALEGAERALVLSSGQAATTTALLGLLAAGDEVVCSAAVYGGTLHLLADFLHKVGIRTGSSSRTASASRTHSLRATRSSSGSSRRSIPRCGAWTSRPWRRPAGRAACYR